MQLTNQIDSLAREDCIETQEGQLSSLTPLGTMKYNLIRHITTSMASPERDSQHESGGLLMYTVRWIPEQWEEVAAP